MVEQRPMRLVVLQGAYLDSLKGVAGERLLETLLHNKKPLLVWVEDQAAAEGPWCRALAARALLAASPSSALRPALHRAGFRKIRVWRPGLIQIAGLLKQELAEDRLQIQIQGPFETSYSLAITNRELATTLAETGRYDVSLYATEGPGDYEPDPTQLALHPEAAALQSRGSLHQEPDVVIRQMWPPRLHDSPGDFTFQYFAWEETRLPTQLVDDFNRHLDGIGVVTPYVAQVLRRSGVVVPIKVVGIGVRSPLEHNTGERMADLPDLANLRVNCLLHISSALPRKGVDVLLKAYFSACSGSDPVSLVLKTHPNPHNKVGILLEELREAYPDPPDVRWINRDLTSSELAHLYARANAYVHPARAEGFGLPVAEAMAARIPVIATAVTGLAGLVSNATAWVIPAQERPASSHVSETGSTWFEPDQQALERALGALLGGEDSEQRQARVEAAATLVTKHHRWEDVAKQWINLIEERRLERRGVDLALVSSYNSPCGIAEYSKSLVEAMPSLIRPRILADLEGLPVDWAAEAGIRRCWWPVGKGNIQVLIDALTISQPDLIHVQTNFGLLDLNDLGRLIDSQHGQRPLVITLHRTKDQLTLEPHLSLSKIAEQLGRASAIVVHEQHDVARLASWGLEHNVVKIPHGTAGTGAQTAVIANGPKRGALVLGTFGFLLPHKGLHVLLATLRTLLDRGLDARLEAHCCLHPSPASQAQLELCQTLIKELDLQDSVTLVTSFQAMPQVIDALGSVDIMVLPYLETGESSSGTLHALLPMGIPLVTSKLDIFEGAAAAGALRQVEAPPDPEALASSIIDLANSTQERSRLQIHIDDYARRTAWTHSGEQHAALYRRLILSQRLSQGEN